jgi:hypothetical protein
MIENKIDKYRKIVLGAKTPTRMQEGQLKKYRYAFGLLCEGFAPLEVVKQLVLANIGVETQSMAFVIVKDAMAIFGNAAKFNKAGLKTANYERLMKLAQMCEQKGDFSTARLLIKDANELMGLSHDENENLESFEDWMKPEAFVIITDPKGLENASKVVEMEWDAEDAEILNQSDEERNQGSQDDLPDPQTS